MATPTAWGTLPPSRPRAAAAGDSPSTQRVPPGAAWAALAELARQAPVAWLLIAALSLLANALMLVPTLYLLQVYDRVMAGRNGMTLLAVSLIALLLLSAWALVDGLRHRALVRLAARWEASCAPRAFDAVLAVPRTAADPGPRRLADLATVRQAVIGPGAAAWFDLPSIPLYLAALVMLHPYLGAMACAFAAIQGLSATVAQRRLDAPSRALLGARADADTFLRSKTRQAEAAQAMGLFDGLLRRWRGHQSHVQAAHARAWSLRHRSAALSRYVRHAQQTLTLAMGAWLVIDGQLSPGAMIAANLLVGRTLAPIDVLAGSWVTLAEARQALLRLVGVERLPAPTHEAVAARVGPMPDSRGATPAPRLDLQRARVEWPGRSQAVIDGVQLSLLPAGVTALVGPSGSGKSTLAQALLGLHGLGGGELHANGQRVQGPLADAVSFGIGYLPQQVQLFAGTVAENIARMGRIDSAAIVRAAQASGTHELILRLPRGYETPVGEDGSLLSGGQRQRIGLARALYGEPTLVVLDEPGAHLDEAGDQALRHAIEGLRARRATVLLVTHQASHLALADHLIALRHGRIEWSGPVADWPPLAGAARPAPSTAASTAAPPASTEPAAPAAAQA